MRGALDVHRALLTADIPHEVVRLRRMVLSADDLPEALGLAATSCVAVHVYAVTGGRGLGEAPFVAVAVSAGATPDPTALLEATDATSVRAATPAEINAVTDYTAGLVPPVALPMSLPLLVDAELGTPPVLYTATGEVGTALGISARHLLTYTNARVATLTRPAPATLDQALRRADGVLDLTDAPRLPGLPQQPAVRSPGVRRPAT